MGNHKIIETPGSRSVRYSMYDFIEAVKQQPVLWDRDYDGFYNREKREQAWFTCGRQLYKNFDDITETEKQKIARTLSKRWKNTRDSFFRALRYRQDGKVNGNEDTTRSYIYEKEMQFLSKSKYDNEDENKLTLQESSNNETVKCSTSKLAANKRNTRKRKTNATVILAAKKRRESFSSICSLNSDFEEMCSEIDRETNGKEAEDRMESQNITTTSQAHKTDVESKTSLCSFELESVTNTSSKEVSISGVGVTVIGDPDPDQAFFDSIKPNIRNMSADKKLDFQIEVLRLLKNFRSN